MNKKVLVTFAGVVGSSKTPIASYLSYKFNLPLFNTDAIRSEVMEDLLSFDEQEYKKRRDIRLSELVKMGKSFILDASVDREWAKYRKIILNEGYRIFMISMDISRERIINLYKTKNYLDSLERVETLYSEHEEFLRGYSNDVSLHITDENFLERLRLSEESLREFLSGLV